MINIALRKHFHRVYCKYHYLEGHEYDTPEEELRHFLKKLAEPNWKWSEQYEIEPFYDHDEIQDKGDRKFIKFIPKMCSIFIVNFMQIIVPEKPFPEMHIIVTKNWCSS